MAVAPIGLATARVRLLTLIDIDVLSDPGVGEPPDDLGAINRLALRRRATLSHFDFMERHATDTGIRLTRSRP